MEEWRDVVGYEGIYQVSNLGRVKSLDRVVLGPSSKKGVLVPHHRKERILKTPPNSRGYVTCTLYSPNGKRYARVHVLVAEAFIPNSDCLPIVRHLNDVKTDNRVENLAWGTYADNSADAVRNERDPRASKTHCIHGHEFTEENTYRRKNGRRVCRRCKRIRKAKQRERERAERIKDHKQ